MHVRRYDASSWRFGVADAVLGALSEPLSLNRYLYCGSDPVNFCDPTGHASSSVRLSRGKPATVNLRGIRPKRKLASWDAGARPGQAGVSQVWRDFNMLSGSVQMHTTRQGAWRAAYGNTVRLNNERAALIEGRYGRAAREAFSAQVARNFKVHVERYYCGSNEHLKETAATLHSFAQDYWYLPVAGTLADWCGYVAEGNVGMAALYSALGLLDVLGAGSVGSLKTGFVQAIKSGGKLSFGSGYAKTAASATSAATKTVVILNRGSTGRTEAAGLLEELAMEATKADPLASATQVKGVQMADSRWLAEDGWVKMQNIVETSQGKN